MYKSRDKIVSKFVEIQDNVEVHTYIFRNQF